MTLIRWEPVAELNTIQNEMNRLFNTFFDQPAAAAGGGAANARWVPAMDLVETADHYVLRADLPGMSEEDVTVQLEGNLLTISGERKPDGERLEEGYFRIERAFGSFVRSLTLPDGVDPGQVQAHFDRGVLEIQIPKPEQRKPRQVPITLGSRSDDDSRTITMSAAEETPANGREPVPA
ncbi:MAG TPA: Hsp20/alpha crystallin family protein [Solirubrobacteraceae bacterium]|nr:Hsp20/alpha crystallin family protein [Solirubrobacteraceae bacterium]